MKDFEARLTDLLARKADEVDIRPVDGFAETPSTTALASTDPVSVTGTRDIATIDLEPTRTKSGPRRRSRRVTHVVLAIAVAAAAVTTMVVISRDHTTAPADTPIPVPSPLEEPSPAEVAAASNAAYRLGSGPTEVTASRSYVSLRSGADGWAYVTGSADSPAVHYGMLGVADDLVLSALDDRMFVASSRVVLAGSAVGTTGMADRLGDRSTRCAAVGGPTDRDGLCRAGGGAARPTTPTDPANSSCPASSTDATGQ